MQAALKFSQLLIHKIEPEPEVHHQTVKEKEEMEDELFFNADDTPKMEVSLVSAEEKEQQLEYFEGLQKNIEAKTGEKFDKFEAIEVVEDENNVD